MDDYHPSILIVVTLIALSTLYAFFMLASIAISKSRSKRLRELLKIQQSGDPKLGRFIISQANSYLLAAQIGIYGCAFTAGVLVLKLTQYTCIESCSRAAGIFGAFEYYFWLAGLSLICVVFTLAIIQTFKAYVFAHPELVLSKVGLVLIFFSRVFKPVSFLLESVLGRVLFLLGVRAPVERELAVSAEELSEIVEMSSEAGEIEEEEKEMIQGVFHFSDTVVREVMTPRQDIVSIQESASLEDILKIFTTERLSRIVVTGADLDDVRGVLLAKDFIGLVGQSVPRFEMRKYMRPAYFVANTKKVDVLLEELKRDAIHFAVVLDEHGGVDGVVTVEDLIEEIVGEIFDEHDSPIDETAVVQTASGDLLIDGAMLIDDLNDNYSLSLPKGQYDTLAGFLIDQLGHIPVQGENLEFDSLKFTVHEMAQNRVTKVLLVPPKKFNQISGMPKDSFETSSGTNESNHKGSETQPHAKAVGSR